MADVKKRVPKRTEPEFWYILEPANARIPPLDAPPGIPKPTKNDKGEKGSRVLYAAILIPESVATKLAALEKKLEQARKPYREGRLLPIGSREFQHMSRLQKQYANLTSQFRSKGNLIAFDYSEPPKDRVFPKAALKPEEKVHLIVYNHRHADKKSGKLSYQVATIPGNVAYLATQGLGRMNVFERYKTLRKCGWGDSPRGVLLNRSYETGTAFPYESVVITEVSQKKPKKAAVR